MYDAQQTKTKRENRMKCRTKWEQVEKGVASDRQTVIPENYVIVYHRSADTHTMTILMSSPPHVSHSDSVCHSSQQCADQ